MKETIAAMKVAFGAFSAGQVAAPLRSRMPFGDSGVALLMPANLAETDDFAVKIVTVNPGNVDRPVVQATVLVFDEATGTLTAVMDGNTVTAIRTGAGGAASADILARLDSHVLAMLGSGVQARAGIEAVCAVRDIGQVRVFGRNRPRLDQFVADMNALVTADVIACDDAAQAVQTADIIYTATDSPTPTFPAAAVQPGSHIIGVGSYTPAMQEVAAAVVCQARVVVDSREAVLAEAGDLLVPIADGTITADHIWAELGEIINGDKPGRTTRDQITFFKSVGIAAQDAMAAHLVLSQRSS